MVQMAGTKAETNISGVLGVGVTLLM